MSMNSLLPDIQSDREKIINLLNQTVIPFWLHFARDKNYGGFRGKLSRDGEPVQKSPKGLVQHARYLWSFSAFFEHTSDPEFQELANWAHQYLSRNFFDEKYNGYFYQLSFDGKPLRREKYIYAQSFVIYAFARYARVFRCAKSKEIALDLFKKIRQVAFDSRFSGFHESFSQDWKLVEQHQDFGIDGFRKTMNCHIHLIEAFTELYRTVPGQEVGGIIQDMIDCILDKIFDPERNSLNLFFEPDWTRLDRVYSFGHDIETAWLLLAASEAVGGYRVQDVQKVSFALIDQVLENGLDREKCGVFYEMNTANEQLKFDRKKVWWVQSEAMVGFLKAYEISKNMKYYDAYVKVVDWVEKYQVDRRYGEWFYEIQPDGTVNGDKAGLWKTPYHNGRACLDTEKIFANLSRKIES